MLKPKLRDNPLTVGLFLTKVYTHPIQSVFVCFSKSKTTIIGSTIVYFTNYFPTKKIRLKKMVLNKLDMVTRHVKKGHFPVY